MSPPNLFEPSSDPRTYIPRPACEDALGRLSDLISNGAPTILLFGPLGLGKSMLLSVLKSRLEHTHQIVYASVSASPEPELCHRIVSLLGAPSDGDPHGALIEAAHASAKVGTPLLILIDHAAGAPIASSLELMRCAEEAAPSLSVVFAVSDEEDAAEFGRTLAEAGPLDTVGFHDVMANDEAVDYIWTRLAQGEAPTEVLERLDDDAVRWVLEASGGLPQVINERAAELLRIIYENEPLPGAPPARDAAPATPSPGEDGAQGPLMRPSQPYLGLSYDGTRQPEARTTPRGSLGGGLIGSASRLDPDLPASPAIRFEPGFLSGGEAPPDLPPAPPYEPPPAPTAAEIAEQRIANARIMSPRFVEATTLATASTAEAASLEAAIAADPAPSGISATHLAEATAPAPAVPALDLRPEPAPAERPAPSESEFQPRRLAAVLATLVAVGIGLFLIARPGPFEGAPAQQTEQTEPAAPPPVLRESSATPAPSVALAPTTEAPARSPEPVAEPAPSPAPPPAPTPAPSPALLPTPTPAPPPSTTAALAPEPEPVRRAAVPRPEPAPAPVAPAPVATPLPTEPSSGASTPAVARSEPKAEPAPEPAEEPASAPVAPVAAAPVAVAVATPAATAPAAPTRATSASPAPVALERSAGSPLPARETAPPSRSATSGEPTPEPAVEAAGPATAIMLGGSGAAPVGAGPTAWVRLKIDCEPGSIVTVDGQQVGVAPLADLMLTPGPHTFVAESPDGLVIEQLIEVTPSTNVVEF